MTITGVISERDVFINTMIVRCGLNPEEMVRRAENTVERVEYKMGGVAIFPDGDLMCARVDHYIISKDPVVYRWRKNEK